MSHNQNHFEADFRFLQDIIHSQIEREKIIFYSLLKIFKVLVALSWNGSEFHKSQI